jgi:alkaline phosphatase
MLVPLSPAAAAPPRQGSPNINIVILPINAARLLVGQRFDLRIEVSGDLANNTDPGSFTVTVDGKPLAAAFGKAPAKSNASPRSAELTVRQVAFNTVGKHSVTVIAGPVARTVTYDVVRAQAPGRPAKNVILFVGDGMEWPMLTIARTVSKGMTEGRFNGKLEMDTMHEVGYVTTSGYDSIVTDSANSASAYATGHKAATGAVGTYADNTADTLDDPRVENIVELVRRSRNMATGLVVTSEIEDATPAAMFAHTRSRNNKQAIADQLLDDPLHRPEVIMGGGAAYFLPKSTPGSKRTDERNLLQEFRNAGYATAGNRAEMNAVGTPQRLLGLFHPDNMNVWIDREYTKDPAVLGPYRDQPALYEMTQKALDVLTATPSGKNGFFLLVEKHTPPAETIR